jgi:hypothetical protein
MKKGILLMALGNENYYRMAVVLAASIKVNDPDLPICLITGNKVQEEHKLLFDIINPPIEKSITVKGAIQFIKAKTYMYEYSPFDETIFLDVDQVMIMGRKLSSLFDELAGIDLAISNTGIAKESIWASIKEVKSLYGNNPFWNYHSEFIYFKKCAAVKSFFKAAIKIYDDNKITTANKFANANMADELAFQAASIKTGIYPHKENWLPNFWFDRDIKNSRKYPFELTEYITYSIGGNKIPNNVKDNYNILAKAYFAKLGLLNPYQVVDKRTFLPERKLI